MNFILPFLVQSTNDNNVDQCIFMSSIGVLYIKWRQRSCVFHKRLSFRDERVSELLDYSPEELTGKSLYRLCHAEDVAVLRECHVHRECHYEHVLMNLSLLHL